MLSCGVTLPLQPFIARFLAEARIASAQLAPNSYRILMCLCLMWKLKGYGPPTPREIRHFYTLRQAGNVVRISFSPHLWRTGSLRVWRTLVKWRFPVTRRRKVLFGAFPLQTRVPVLLDGEISHLAAAAVLPLDLRDRSFLLDKEKMIAQWVFTRLPARLPRLCDFDTVCDLQAQVVKNSEAASKKHAAGLAKEGIASPDGDDPSDGKEAGDVLEEVSSQGSPLCVQRLLRMLLLRLLLLRLPPAVKVRRKLVLQEGSVTSLFLTRMSMRLLLILRVIWPPELVEVNAQLRVPLIMLLDPLSGHQGWCSMLSLRTRRVLTSQLSPKLPLLKRLVREGPTEGTNAAVPPPEEVNELNIPVSTPPRTASPLVSMGESNVSLGRPESVDRPGPSKQLGTSASGSDFAYKAPPAGPTEANEGTVSLSDFSAIEICSHLINNDMYIGEGWEHVKGKSCNRKMEFFFNCHSLMMSELAENYKYGNKASREIKRLRDRASTLAAEKLSVEESHASQESLAARLEAEWVAEEAKEKAEREALDLRNQLSSRELIFDNLKAVLEAEAVDRFKRSPTYDALLLREFFAMKDHSNDKALRRFDRSLQQHMASGGSFSGSGAEPDLGPVAGRDYGPFMPDRDEDVTWPSEEEIEDEEDSEGPHAAS
ncbi:hypothetical protein LWI29_035401 [Acer saccharum]|uniref:Uncharacterized protein n=1 Tax=Acer saccharum TaxID=4024 RepID=A0AA39VEP1_ACESA|nr:hypothetical protein LWI29_035401 [Acer saccharum]